MRWATWGPNARNGHHPRGWCWGPQRLPYLYLNTHFGKTGCSLEGPGEPLPLKGPQRLETLVHLLPPGLALAHPLCPLCRHPGAASRGHNFPGVLARDPEGPGRWGRAWGHLG